MIATAKSRPARRASWLPGPDDDRAELVCIRGGDRVDREPRDSRRDDATGCDTNAGMIPWDAVDGFLTWYAPASRWIFTPME